MAMEYRAIDADGRSESDWLPQRSEAEQDAAELIAGGEIDVKVAQRVVSPAVVSARGTSEARRRARLIASPPARSTTRRSHLSLVENTGG